MELVRNETTNQPSLDTDFGVTGSGSRVDGGGVVGVAEVGGTEVRGTVVGGTEVRGTVVGGTVEDVGVDGGTAVVVDAAVLAVVTGGAVVLAGAVVGRDVELEELAPCPVVPCFCAVPDEPEQLTPARTTTIVSTPRWCATRRSGRHAPRAPRLSGRMCLLSQVSSRHANCAMASARQKVPL